MLLNDGCTEDPSLGVYWSNGPILLYSQNEHPGYAMPLTADTERNKPFSMAWPPPRPVSGWLCMPADQGCSLASQSRGWEGGREGMEQGEKEEESRLGSE